MDNIKALFDLDWVAILLSIFIIMFGFVAIINIIGKFSELIGKPVKWVKGKKQDHELLMKTVEDLKCLHNKHEEDTKQSIRHDTIIRDDLKKLTSTVDTLVNKIDIMQSTIDATEMAKLKEKILGYYRKYSQKGEWEQFESDVFWGLYDRYISHGGNSFVEREIEPVMRKLKIKD